MSETLTVLPQSAVPMSQLVALLSSPWGLLTWTNALLIVVALAAVYLTRMLAGYSKQRAFYTPQMPGFAEFLSFVHPLRLLFPWLYPSKLTRDFMSFDLYKVFEEYNTPVLRYCSHVRTTVYINDADLVKEMVTTRKRDFPKPVHLYSLISFFGPNIVNTEEKEWLRHRLVCNPAFGDANNALVAQTTVDSFKAVLRKWQRTNRKADSDELDVDVSNSMTDLTLRVIAWAGFGRKMEAPTDPTEAAAQLPPGHTLTFLQCMEGVTDLKNGIMRGLLPKFVRSLLQCIPSMRRADRCFTEFEQYLREFVREGMKTEAADGSRLAVGDGSRKAHDLLHLLLEGSSLTQHSDGKDQKPRDARDSDEETVIKTPLNEQEVISDSYIFLFAGHETTAHTLSFAIGLLALHPDIQEKLYKSCREALGGRDPTYEDYKRDQLYYAHCIVLETLRLFPIVPSIPKWCPNDTQLGPYKLMGGTMISIHVDSLHRNPKYFPEPHAFRPERFDERVSPPMHKFAFAPFSVGSRSCIGRNFALIEATLVLVMLSQAYSIHVHPQYSSPADSVSKSIGLTVNSKVPVRVLLRPRQPAA